MYRSPLVSPKGPQSSCWYIKHRHESKTSCHMPKLPWDPNMLTDLESPIKLLQLTTYKIASRTRRRSGFPGPIPPSWEWAQTLEIIESSIVYTFYKS